MQRPTPDDAHPPPRSDQPPNRSARRGAKDHTPRPIRPAARTSQSPVPLDSVERTLTKRQRVGTRKACDHCRLKKIRVSSGSERCHDRAHIISRLFGLWLSDILVQSATASPQGVHLVWFEMWSATTGRTGLERTRYLQA